MQIAKWGNSLAVRIPKTLADDLELKEGDEVEVVAKDSRTVEIRRAMTREEAIEEIKKLQRPLPPGFKFNRDEANER